MACFNSLIVVILVVVTNVNARGVKPENVNGRSLQKIAEDAMLVGGNGVENGKKGDGAQMERMFNNLGRNQENGQLSGVKNGMNVRTVRELPRMREEHTDMKSDSASNSNGDSSSSSDSKNNKSNGSGISSGNQKTDSSNNKMKSIVKRSPIPRNFKISNDAMKLPLLEAISKKQAMNLAGRSNSQAFRECVSGAQC